MPVLPVEAYTSEAWFDREQARIFSRTWAFAGLAEDVAEPGQYAAVPAGLNNIFVVMGGDRRLRAFHNVCRHRGTQLLRPLGKAKKAITCPYHDWTYDLEGRLIGVPNRKTEFPDLDTTCLGLKPAAVDRWRGMLWVHPDASAGPVTDWFGEVEPLLGPHRVDELVEYPKARTSTDVAANWKIVVENYIDAYHLAHLHAGTLAMYDHSKIESGFVGPHFAFWEPAAAEYLDGIEGKAEMPLIDHVPRDRIGAWVPMLFPGHRTGGDRELVVGVPRHPARAEPDARGDQDEGGERVRLGVHAASGEVGVVLGVAHARQVPRRRGRGPARVGRLHGRRRPRLRTAAEVAAEPVLRARPVFQPG